MSERTTAFVLGGGGHRGGYEVGMLMALAERAVVPDIVVGTSIGAINGALYAASPDVAGVGELAAAWEELRFADLFPGTLWDRTKAAVEQRTYLHANDHLRAWLDERLPVERIEELPLRFECVAARIEDSTEHWFTHGPILDALLASSAVPGLLPPVVVDGMHHIDGGVVNSIPLSRAYEHGADEIYILHVGHIDDELDVPARPWDVGVVAFEIARRHRFASDLANVPAGTAVHVLPTGAPPGRYNDPAKLRYGNLGHASDQIAAAHAAAGAFLDGLDPDAEEPADGE